MAGAALRTGRGRKDMLLLGCYAFRFGKPLDQDDAQRLEALLQDGGPARNPAFAYAWLRQHDIKFRLSFRWDHAQSWKANLDQLERPWMMRKLLEAYDGEVMALPLEKYADALRGR